MKAGATLFVVFSGVCRRLSVALLSGVTALSTRLFPGWLFRTMKHNSTGVRARIRLASKVLHEIHICVCVIHASTFYMEKARYHSELAHTMMYMYVVSCLCRQKLGASVSMSMILAR